MPNLSTYPICFFPSQSGKSLIIEEVLPVLVRQLEGPAKEAHIVHINFDEFCRDSTYEVALEGLLFRLYKAAKDMRRKPPDLPSSGQSMWQLEHLVLEFFHAHSDELIFYTWDEVRHGRLGCLQTIKSAPELNFVRSLQSPAYVLASFHLLCTTFLMQPFAPFCRCMLSAGLTHGEGATSQKVCFWACHILPLLL